MTGIDLQASVDLAAQLVENNLKQHIPLDSPPLKILEAALGSNLQTEKLKKLEIELTDRTPYKSTARYFQLIARKK